MKDIERIHSKNEEIEVNCVITNQINSLAMTPQQASHAEGEFISIYDAIGRISADSIMIYPPGIPLVIPGEIISEQVVALYDFYSRNIGNVLVETKEKNHITVIKGDR